MARVAPTRQENRGRPQAATSNEARGLASSVVSERLDQWMDGYIAAWASNDPASIAALFTPDAVYDPQTASGPWEGHDEIVEGWLEVGDSPDSWEFEWAPLVETDDLGIITGVTRYLDPATTYRNLWVIRFDADGRCRDFTEWYIEEAT